MAYSNGIISEPVSVGNVQNALGDGSDDLSLLCKSNKINKWSFHKPVIHAKKSDVSDDDIKSVHCGLALVSLSKLISANYYASGTTTYSTSEILSSIYECTYNRPAGGSSSPYRLGDFKGYNVNAKSPDKSWGNFSVNKETLNTYANTGVTQTNGGGSYDFVIDESFGNYSNFAMRFGESTANQIGGADSMMLPMTYIAGDLLDGSWRIALAINIDGRWDLIIGRAVLSSDAQSGTAIDQLLPDFATNSVLMKRIIDSQESSFDCIPVLVKNALVAYTSVSAGILRSYVTLDSGAVIYAMPSGQGNITLNASGTVSGAINGKPILAECSVASMIVAANGSYGGPSGTTPVFNVLLVSRVPYTIQHKVNYDFWYNIYGSNIASHAVGTLTINAGATAAIDGYTYYGTIINGGLGYSVVTGDSQKPIILQTIY